MGVFTQGSLLHCPDVCSFHLDHSTTLVGVAVAGLTVGIEGRCCTCIPAGKLLLSRSPFSSTLDSGQQAEVVHSSIYGTYGYMHPILLANVTPLLCRCSWEVLLLPPLTEFLLMIPGGCTESRRCRLLRRKKGLKLPLERRRWRLESMAAGDTIPAGGTLPRRL